MKGNKKENQSSYVRVFSLMVDTIWIFVVVGLASVLAILLI